MANISWHLILYESLQIKALVVQRFLVKNYLTHPFGKFLSFVSISGPTKVPLSGTVDK